MTEEEEQRIRGFFKAEKKDAITRAKAYAKTHNENILVSYNKVLDNGDIVVKWWRATND